MQGMAEIIERLKDVLARELGDKRVLMSVRYFRDVAASAGGGAFDADEAHEYLEVGEDLAGVMGLDRGRIEAIHVTGDSMEPTLGDGDLIFIDRDKTQPARGGIYVIATPHGLFIKRLQNRLDGQVDVVSDNPGYPVQTLPSEEITVVGRAVHTLKGL